MRLARSVALVGTAGMALASLALPANASPPPDASSASAAQDPGYTWSNVEITGGGYVPAILFNPTQQGLAYARTDVGGAYRFDAATERWTPLLDHVGWEDWGHSGVLSLATDPVEPNRVYAAVGG